MKIGEQRNELRSASIEAEESIRYFMQFLQSDKFKGQGEDWIRTNEVHTVLRDIANKLKFSREDI